MISGWIVIAPPWAFLNFRPRGFRPSLQVSAMIDGKRRLASSSALSPGGYFFLQRIRQAMPDITESTDQQIRGLRSTRPSVANFRDNDNLHSDLTNRTNQSNIEDRTIIAPSRPCSL